MRKAASSFFRKQGAPGRPRPDPSARRISLLHRYVPLLIGARNNQSEADIVWDRSALTPVIDPDAAEPEESSSEETLVTEEEQEHIQSTIRKANLLAKSGQTDQARVKLDRLLENYPHHGELLAACGDLQMQQQAFPDAIFYFDRLISLAPTQQPSALLIHYYFQRATAYYQLDLFNSAISDCSKAIELHSALCGHKNEPNTSDEDTYEIENVFYLRGRSYF